MTVSIGYAEKLSPGDRAPDMSATRQVTLISTDIAVSPFTSNPGSGDRRIVFELSKTVRMTSTIDPGAGLGTKRNRLDFVTFGGLTKAADCLLTQLATP